MRKSVVMIAVFLFSVSMFAGVTKSELAGGVRYYFKAGGIEGLRMYDVPDTVNQLNYVNIPYVDYRFEIMLGKLFKIYAHPSIGYKFLKGTEDGTAPIGYDRYATEFYLSVKPMLKFYLPKPIFKMDGFFAKGGLPIYTRSISPQQEVALGNKGYAIHFRTVDIFMNLGYDNRKIDQHLLTPWDSFEQGWAAYATYDEHLIQIESGVEIIATLTELPRYFGIAGCYSHLVKKENMMVKLGLDYKYQLNENYLGGGHKDSMIDLDVLFACDVIKEVNASAKIGFSVEELERTAVVVDADGNVNEYGNYIDFVFGMNGHYYPVTLFDIYGGFELRLDLTTEDAEPEFKFELGAAAVFK